MKIGYKVSIATVLTLPVTFFYYLIYVLVEKKLSVWCKTNYCFEFPPYADVLAIWVAIIGLYFVVTSLDAWKHQDQYQTAKQNIKLLHDIQDKLEAYTAKLQNLDKNDYGPHVFRLSSEQENVLKTRLFTRYESYIYQCEIYELIDNTKKVITLQSKNLYQNDFEVVINLAFKYVRNIDINIKDLNKNAVEKYQYELVQAELIKKDLQEEINNMPEGKLKSTQLALLSLGRLSNIQKPQLADLEQIEISEILNIEHTINTEYKNKLNSLQKKINNYIE